MEKEKMENSLPEWQLRLIDERRDLLKKTIALKNAIDDKSGLKLTRKEWEMLTNQYYQMRDYLQALTDRCVYYELIESGDLGLHY